VAWRPRAAFRYWYGVVAQGEGRGRGPRAQQRGPAGVYGVVAQGEGRGRGPRAQQRGPAGVGQGAWA
jgi:hypothetical protein